MLKKYLTLFDTLEPHGVFTVFDHSVDIPGGQSSHGGVVDFQQQVLLEEFTAVAHGSAREKLPDDRELSMFRAALQIQPQLPLLIPAKDTLMDFVGPVVLPLLQSLGHGEFYMSAAVQENEKFLSRCLCPHGSRWNASRFSGKAQLYPCQRSAAGSSVCVLDN